MKKLVGMVAGASFALVLIISNLFLLMFMVIWIVLSNYEMCTIPFEKECWSPDKIYKEDPITDREIRELVHGEFGMLDTRDKLVNGDTIYHYNAKGELDIEEDLLLSSGAQTFIKDVPILDAESVRRVNAEEKEKAIDEKDNANEDVVYEEEEEKGSSDTSSEGVYLITNKTPIDDAMRDKLERLLYRTDVKVDGRGNKFAELKSRNILDTIIKAGQDNNIDPVFMVAVSMHETGNGTSFSLHSRNNVGGIRCPNLTPAQKQEFGYVRCEETASNGKFSVWSSVEGSIRYKAYLLNNFYANDNPPRLTVKDVGLKYAPITDLKDPDAMNAHWITQVSTRLTSLGIANVGGFGIGGIITLPPLEGTKKPNFEAYNFSKIYFDGKVDNDIYKLKGKQYWNAHEERVKLSTILNESDDKSKDRAAFKDKTEKEVQDYVNEHFSKYTVEDAMISEAELQLKTLVQFDLEGTIGMNEIQYETAQAMLRFTRQVENAQRGFTDEDYKDEDTFYKMKNERPLSTARLKEYREEYITFLKNIDEYDPSKTIDENIMDSVDFNSKNRNYILTKAAISDKLYPFLVIVLEKAPAKYTSDLGIEILDKFEKYNNEKEIKPVLLSTLSVGRLMQRNASQYFMDNYAWFSLDKDELQKNFENYVSDERQKAKKGLKKFTEGSEKGFWGTLASDVANNPLSIWNWNSVGEAMSHEYMDLSVRDNIFIKFGIYNKTREMMELGAFTRDICFYKEAYNSQTCSTANNSAYGAGVYLWEESDVLDKTKQNAVFTTYCEYVPDTDGDGIHDHKDFFPNDATKTKEEDAEENVKEPTGGSILDGKYDKAGPGVQTTAMSNNSTDEETIVAGWVSEWLNKKSEKASNFFEETGSQIGTWAGEFTGWLAGEVNTKAPKSPHREKLDLYISDLPKQLKLKYEDETEKSIEKVYKGLKSKYGKEYGKKVGLKDDYGVVVGYVVFSKETQMEVHFIDVVHNRQKTFSYKDEAICNPDTEIEKSTYNKSIVAYYPTTYEMMAKTKNFNMYHTKLDATKNTPEKFKEEVLALYQEMTNVDYVENESFVKDFNEYLTNRSVGLGGGTGTGGFVPGTFPGADKAIIDGLETQMPLSSNILRFTSLMGSRSCGGCSSNHKGNDITAQPKGPASVVAFANGILFKKSDGHADGNKGANGGMGNYVVLKHPTEKGTIYSVSMHMKQGTVTTSPIGTEIPIGTKIGDMGNTGNSYGQHLHFEIIQSESYDRTKHVNATPFLPITPQNSVCKNGINKPEVCKEMGLKFVP